MHADFDFLHAGEPAWTIEIETDAGGLTLAQGGHRLHIDGKEINSTPQASTRSCMRALRS